MKDSVLRSRFSSSVLRFALLAVIVSAIFGGLVRLPAQELTAAPGEQAPASSSADAAKSEADSSGDEGNNAFLQSPTVKATAKMLHLKLETAEAILLGINFAILALAIGIPLFRILPRILRARSEKVQTDLESARKATGDANARLNAIESKLSGLDGEIAQIRAQVETESLLDEARIKATIGEETARIVAAAEQEIGSSAAQARRSLRNFAADLAIGQAASQLVLSQETDQALIAEFLSAAALNPVPANGANKGGQN